MKKPVFFLPALFAAILCCLIFYFFFGRGDAYAQNAGGRSALVTRTAMTSSVDSRVEAPGLAGKFSSAAGRNSGLGRSLSWAFAGKAQTGWQIYVPLISHTIDTSSHPDSPQFAAALSIWQGKNGLMSDGVLDSDTLQSFVRHWQSQRLGRSGSPGEDRLLAAPITDFYDSTRDADLLHLERETYAAYKQMLAAAAKDLGESIRFTKSGELADGEKLLRIVSAYRSPAYQAALRRREPNAGRGALAKFSTHATGHALDLYVGGEPVSTKDPNRLLQVESPAYKWLVKNANRFGFYNYFYEPWHWEYVPGR